MKKIDKIVQTLIINGTLVDSPGLFYGKTGVAIFFFHYARQTGDKLFLEYAADLMEEVQKQITVTIPAQYDIGLSGIGVGFEFLLQNELIETKDDDVFEDFDARMYRTVMYEPYPDLSLERGLSGWGRYFIYRLRGKRKNNSILNKALTFITDEISKNVIENSVPESDQPDIYRFYCDLFSLPQYAEKYANSLQQCREWDCIRKSDIQKIFPYMYNLQRLHVCQNYFNKILTEEIGKEWEKWKVSDYRSLTNMGILNGWATEGLLYLTLFQNLDHSWLNLL